MPRLMSLEPITSMTWRATKSLGAATVSVRLALSSEMVAPESLRS